VEKVYKKVSHQKNSMADNIKFVNEFLKGGGKSGTDFAIKKKIPPTSNV
jgi:hypothetical protein